MSLERLFNIHKGSYVDIWIMQFSNTPKPQKYVQKFPYLESYQKYQLRVWYQYPFLVLFLPENYQWITMCIRSPCLVPILLINGIVGKETVFHIRRFGIKIFLIVYENDLNIKLFFLDIFPQMSHGIL